jgi:anti-sigma-K factor RskA
MDDAKEELAVRYVLGELSSSEEERFRAELEQDQELSEATRDMGEAFASLALIAPPRAAPAGLPDTIMQAISKGGSRQAIRVWNFMPWALAACLAALCAVLAAERIQSRRNLAAAQNQQALSREELATLRSRDALAQKELTDLRSQGELFQKELADVRNKDGLFEKELANLHGKDELSQKQLADLRSKDALSQMKIATLQSLVDTFARTSAVVIWDPDKKSGIVQFNNLPAPKPGKNYQLWVIDPKLPQPISAGLIPPSESGVVKVNFKPAQVVGSAAKFAVSIEDTGESATPGQIIFLGQ